MPEEYRRTLNYYAMDGKCHSAGLWLFSLTKDLDVSEICIRKAKITLPVVFMMYSEYLIWAATHLPYE